MRKICFFLTCRLMPLLLSLGLLFSLPVFAAESDGNASGSAVTPVIENNALSENISLDLSLIPDFTDQSFVTVHDNIPDFYISQIRSEPYVIFSSLDESGRTQSAMACLGSKTIPTEPRGQIGNITPSGWQTTRYDDRIEDKYLYNRCHVIGYQLCGDNATPENLFTGTRFLNSDTMLYFENMIASYLNRNPDYHVIYRVTPHYRESDLVASGVQLEAFSVEDYGEGICFNVFLYNIQPGVVIDYATGESYAENDYVPGKVLGAAAIFGTLEEPELLKLVPSPTSEPAGEREIAPETSEDAAQETNDAEVTYILNTNTGKFHYPNCDSVDDMKPNNKQEFYGTREEAVAEGYQPCGRCHP